MKFEGTPHAESVRKVKKPGGAAHMGRKRTLPLRKDWEEVKDMIMEEALVAKFT
jgi:predicted NAD-dependent protein-ADP-ribosyltransferase YbiA (DUF1768 family)